MAVVPGVGRTGWASTYPADINARILAVVTGGAPFAGACTPLPTNRSKVSFPILDSADPAWSAELGLIPDLAPTQTAYEVAVSRLNGSLLISRESVDDTDYPVSQQTEVAIQERFSAKLDRDFVQGAGSAPAPTGILSVATAADGTDLLLAAVAAKAAIGTSGGTATRHRAESPLRRGP